VLWPNCEQIISAKFPDVLVNELGVVVRLVWKTALRVDTKARKDVDAPSYKAMSEATNTAEQVHARDHVFCPGHGRRSGLMNRDQGYSIDSTDHNR
jgi:hypothetical protein